MDKKDVMYLAAALVLVLVIALVIKPLVTGQPIQTGIPAPTTYQTLTIAPTQNTLGVTQVVTTLATPAPTVIPTTVPIWNPNAAQTVGFVDPLTYGLSTNESGPKGTRINSSGLDTNMTTFATVSSPTGTGGTTGIMYIPFPYWELVYTISPAGELVPASASGTVKQREGISYSWSGVSGSYSTVKPDFTIQVMDGDDPNRIVRTVTPPGGIDLDLWTGKKSTSVYPEKTKKYASTTLTDDTKVVDPRPWTEKFYEGQRNYYFIITAQSLNSYSIEIKVPSRYIGKY